jgi:phytanoyl-CoA hydroxylase
MSISANRRHWESEGYVFVRGLFSQEEIDHIREHFMEWNASDRKEDFDKIDSTGQDPLAQYPRIIHPHRKDPLSLDFMLDPRLRDVMTDLLGEEPLAAQTMFYFKPPTARGQALHQDQMYLRARPGTCVAAWMAVDDCDEENGCMDIVPGSHKLPLLCHVEADLELSFTSRKVPVPEGYAPIPALMNAGDVLFFHGNLIHGSGPNTSATRFRRALIGHYITADAKAAAHFYHPLLRFDGTVLDLEDEPGGSQCGVVGESGIEMVASVGAEIAEPH